MMTNEEKQQVKDTIETMKPMEKLSKSNQAILTVTVLSTASALLARQTMEQEEKQES